MVVFSGQARSVFAIPWTRYVLIGSPILMLPLILVDFGDKYEMPMRCAYVTILMAIYWAMEILPVAVTGLLPIVLLPFLRISSPTEASAPYFREENVLFLCCLMIAIAVEQSNVHRRLALRILLSVGTNFQWLLLSFMFTTAAFGVLINNSAAAAMMIPIADAVLEQVFPSTLPDETTEAEVREGRVTVAVIRTPVNEPRSERDKIDVKTIVANNKKCFYLCLAYAATMGSCASLTSNGPNLVLKRTLEEFSEGVPVDYASWMGLCLPGVFLVVAVIWYIMKSIYCRQVPGSDRDKEAAAAKSAIETKYRELGPFTFHEVATLVLVLGLVFLWMFRNPNFLKGWSEYFCDLEVEPDTSNRTMLVAYENSTLPVLQFEGGFANSTHSLIELEAQDHLRHAEWLRKKKNCYDMKPKDSTAAMAVLLLMFVIPTRPFTSSRATLVDWATVQKKLAWGLLFMRGGGFSIANAVETSQLSARLSDFVAGFDGLGPLLLILLFIVVSSVLTEFLSNTATTLILLPIAKDISLAKDMNPLILMIVIALSCSLAFVLPVGTPPNSLVFAHQNYKTSEMVIPGLIVKGAAVVLMLAITLAIATPMYDLTNSTPDWVVNYLSIVEESKLL